MDDRGDDVIISTRVTSSGGTGQGADEAARDNTQGDPNAVPALVLGVAVPAEGGGHYDRITVRYSGGSSSLLFCVLGVQVAPLRFYRDVHLVPHFIESTPIACDFHHRLKQPQRLGWNVD